MFLVRKAAWAGIIFILLMTGISGSRPTPVASGSNLSKEVLAGRNWVDVKKMQEALHDKGHYIGKVDGVFGLRTRASIRRFQKAESLAATGQIDPQTADKLGVMPESRGTTGHEMTQSKPSAGTKWTKGSRRTRKTVRKAAAGVAPEIDRADREKILQAEIDSPPQ